MPDCVGIDQLRTGSEACLAFATAKLGTPPVFWGRYFKNAGNTSPDQYQRSLEANFFNQHNISILPVGRQTGNVSQADHALGRQDGLDNAAAMIASFGAAHLGRMPEVAVFLDAEIDKPLNHIYYGGWSEGLIAGGNADPANPVTFVPCLYAHHNDGTSWTELGKALAAGAVCGAAWIVFMDTGAFPIGPWQAKFTSPHMPATVRVAITQRILDLKDPQGRDYDFDLVNPVHQAWLLPRLTVPEHL